jgi:hypothetical protein
MSGITILDVKIVGVCSKHANNESKLPHKKDGTVFEDKDIACIDCMFKENNQP